MHPRRGQTEQKDWKIFQGLQPQELQLFQLMLPQYGQSTQQGRPGKIRPGHFVLLLAARPSLKERSQIGQTGARRRWQLSPSLQELENLLAGDAAGPVLAMALERAREFGITDGTRICRLMIAMLQLVCPLHDQELQRRYKQIAERALKDSASIPVRVTRHETEEPRVLPAWWRESLRLQARADEEGQSVAAGNIRLWYGSHQGTPEKKQNQDATCARTAGGLVFFALADGVSTSLASREAAAIATRAFCEHLVRSFSGRKPIADSLSDALTASRNSLRLLRDEMERFPSRYRECFSDLQPAAVEYMFRESRKENAKRPVLACTFLGGILVPQPGGASLDLLRLGDGEVELVSNGRVNPVFTMNAAENAIGTYMGPDDKSQQMVAETMHAEMKNGEWLLVSSDGLVRGHSEPIWQKLREILPRFPDHYMVEERPNSARLMLNEVYQSIRNTAQDSLFQDNWSIILARAGRAR